MIKAFVMMLVKVGELENVLEQLRKIPNIESISVVTGEWDIITKAGVETLEGLMKLTDKIQLIGNIEKTTTQVVEKEISL